jgi:putative lipoic acid-binding regulatory protein
MNNDTDAFYERLKTELDNSNTWPTEYLFKFIVPTTADNVEIVGKAFNNLGAIIKTTKSRTAKFTSISIDVTMESAQQIIQKYQDVSHIVGIVSL